MVELERHIEILLLEHDCVIVPELGGFMAHRVEARYDEEGIFLPPYRTLGFNQQLRLNDSLLAQSYVEAYDISFPDAVVRISNEVEELKLHLRENGEYELQGLGTLVYIGDDKYSFEPCEAGILTPELYGLSSIDIHKLVDFNSIQDTSFAEDIDDNLLNGNENKTSFGIDSKRRALIIPINTLRNIAAACIVISVFFIFPSFNTNNISGLKYSTIDIDLLSLVMPKWQVGGNLIKETPKIKIKEKDTVVLSSNDVLDKKIEEKRELNSVATEKRHEDITTTDYYGIVLASKVTKTNAETLVSRLKKQGYKDAQVLMRSNGAKVVYGHYNNEDEAQTTLRKLRVADVVFADGWVMKF